MNEDGLTVTASSDTIESIEGYLKSIGAVKKGDEWFYRKNRVIPVWDHVESKWFVIVRNFR